MPMTEAISGPGAVGEDLGPLILTSILLGEFEFDQLEDLECIALEGYRQGLKEEGWLGNPDDPKKGYLASAVLRFPKVLFRRIGRSVKADQELDVKILRYLASKAVEANSWV